ncbi:hypothetical protein BgiBS90_020102 [Biomphalaria glabrata]|nr:hypothetical protein BgiBS90_020102 [Biomphalaria glabrata]
MANIFLILFMIYINVHLTESQLFNCSRPAYDKLEETEPGVCLYTLCVHCVSKTTSFQDLNYTFAIQMNGTVWTLDKENALYSTQDTLTDITFPFNDSLGFSLFDGPVQFQFSMSALEEDGNVIRETNPWTAQELFKAPDFICGSADYDRSQTPRYEMCRHSLCVVCVSNVTYQQINATLGFLFKIYDNPIHHEYRSPYTISVGYSSNKTTFYLTKDHKTVITFPFNEDLMEIVQFEHSTQYQFSMSAIDNEGRLRETFSPLSEPIKYKSTTEIYFTINGKNDSFIEESGDTLVFLCTSNGYPPPLLYLDSLVTYSSKLFEDNLIYPDTPVNITIRGLLVTGYYLCYHLDKLQYVEKKIFVLSHSQLRLMSNIYEQKDLEFQSLGYLDFWPDYEAYFSVIGYPAPYSMQLWSNGDNITEGVELTYGDTSDYVNSNIYVKFTDHALLVQQKNYSLTVNNGHPTSFTFVCGDCNFLANSCTIKSNAMSLNVFLLVVRLLSQ